MPDKKKKPILIDFSADWCGWCVKMDKEVFSSPEVDRILSRDYITIRINVDANGKLVYRGKRYTPNELSAHFGVTGLPTCVFLESNGSVITAVPGYVEKKNFIPILTYLKDSCYKKNIDFKEYVQGKTSCK